MLNLRVPAVYLTSVFLWFLSVFAFRRISKLRRINPYWEFDSHPVNSGLPEDTMNLRRAWGFNPLNERNAFAGCLQNIRVEVFGVLGPLVNLTKLLVPQKSDHLVQTQAGTRKRCPSQLFKHFLLPCLRSHDEQGIVRVRRLRSEV